MVGDADTVVAVREKDEEGGRGDDLKMRRKEKRRMMMMAEKEEVEVEGVGGDGINNEDVASTTKGPASSPCLQQGNDEDKVTAAAAAPPSSPSSASSIKRNASSPGVEEGLYDEGADPSPEFYGFNSKTVMMKGMTSHQPHRFSSLSILSTETSQFISQQQHQEMNGDENCPQQQVDDNRLSTWSNIQPPPILQNQSSPEYPPRTPPRIKRSSLVNSPTSFVLQGTSSTPYVDDATPSSSSPSPPANNKRNSRVSFLSSPNSLLPVTSWDDPAYEEPQSSRRPQQRSPNARSYSPMIVSDSARSSPTPRNYSPSAIQPQQYTRGGMQQRNPDPRLQYKPATIEPPKSKSKLSQFFEKLVKGSKRSDSNNFNNTPIRHSSPEPDNQPMFRMSKQQLKAHKKMMDEDEDVPLGLSVVSESGASLRSRIQSRQSNYDSKGSAVSAPNFYARPNSQASSYRQGYAGDGSVVSSSSSRPNGSVLTAIRQPPANAARQESSPSTTPKLTNTWFKWGRSKTDTKPPPASVAAVPLPHPISASAAASRAAAASSTIQQQQPWNPRESIDAGSRIRPHSRTDSVGSTTPNRNTQPSVAQQSWGINAEARTPKAYLATTPNRLSMVSLNSVSRVDVPVNRSSSAVGLASSPNRSLLDVYLDDTTRHVGLAGMEARDANAWKRGSVGSFRRDLMNRRPGSSLSNRRKQTPTDSSDDDDDDDDEDESDEDENILAQIKAQLKRRDESNPDMQRRGSASSYRIPTPISIKSPASRSSSPRPSSVTRISTRDTSRTALNSDISNDGRSRSRGTEKGGSSSRRTSMESEMPLAKLKMSHMRPSTPDAAYYPPQPHPHASRRSTNPNVRLNTSDSNSSSTVSMQSPIFTGPQLHSRSGPRRVSSATMLPKTFGAPQHPNPRHSQLLASPLPVMHIQQPQAPQVMMVTQQPQAYYVQQQPAPVMMVPAPQPMVAVQSPMVHNGYGSPFGVSQLPEPLPVMPPMLQNLNGRARTSGFIGHAYGGQTTPWPMHQQPVARASPQSFIQFSQYEVMTSRNLQNAIAASNTRPSGRY